MERHVTGAFVLYAGLVAGPAWAQSYFGPLDHCERGDVEPNTHANYQLSSNVDWADGVPVLCQNRSWYEPNEGICYCEHDTFLAGDVESESKFAVPFGLWSSWEFVDLMQIITTPDDASAPYAEPFLNPVHSFSHVWCIDDDGDGRCEGFEKEQLVQKQGGLVFSGLPPGNYWVSFDVDHPAEELFDFEYPYATVTNFRVLPHEVAHELGRPTSYGGSVACPQETACDDGIDNEGDGFTDCGDKNCTGSAPCTETDAECVDDVDNDGDGSFDCDDLDCFFGPNCFFPWPVPGRVEAENFNVDGPEVAYHDVDSDNDGWAYRDEGVDIVEGGDGTLRVGWTVNGEWLRYNLEVQQTATYHLTARVSSACGSDCPGQNVLAAFIGDVQVATFTFDDTGGWETFVDVPGLASGGLANIPLTASLDSPDYVLRLEVVNAGFDIDYVEFTLAQ